MNENIVQQCIYQEQTSIPHTHTTFSIYGNNRIQSQVTKSYSVFLNVASNEHNNAVINLCVSIMLQRRRGAQGARLSQVRSSGGSGWATMETVHVLEAQVPSHADILVFSGLIVTSK